MAKQQIVGRIQHGKISCSCYHFIFYFFIPKRFVNYDYAFSIEQKKDEMSRRKITPDSFSVGENLIDGTDVK